ncbi:MAG: SpoIIE family protein phosphatase [Kiritimatiellia bacterium]
MLDHPLFWLLAASSAGLAVVSTVAVHHLKRYRRKHAALAREKEVVYGFVQDMGEVFTETDNAESGQLLRQVLHYALRTARGSAGAIYLNDEKAGGLILRCASGIFPPPYPGFPESDYLNAPSRSGMLQAWLEDHPPPAAGVLHEVAGHGRPILIAQAAGDPRIPHHKTDLLQIDSFLAVPMRFRRHVIGLVAVNRADAMLFRRGDLNLLQTLADQASVSIYYASLREDLEEKRKLEREMEVAQGIQASLLPKTLPTSPASRSPPSPNPPEVGGDYYDVIRVDDDHIGIVIADVAGKSVGGAILMAACRSTLRACPGPHPSCRSAGQVLNQAMQEDLAGDPYITMVYAVLDLRGARLRVARAGHESPLLLRAGGAGAEPVAPGFAVGLVDPEAFSSILVDQTIELRRHRPVLHRWHPRGP